MVDEREILKQYSYKATSNLVLEQDRRRIKDKDAVGVSALQAGNLPGRMGDRVNRVGEKSSDLQQRLDRHRERNEAGVRASKRTHQEDLTASNGILGNAGDVDVVEAAEDFEMGEHGAAYVPSNAVSQRAYEALMAFITSKLGDQPQDLLRGAADETLALLKDSGLVQLDQKKQIESVLGSMNGDEFSRLSLLGRQISDFDVNDAKGADKPYGSADDLVADDVGVAVVYDADEEENGDGDDSDEAVDEVVELEQDVDDIVSPGESGVGKGKATGEDNTYILDAADGGTGSGPFELDPRKINAYWIQEQLSRWYSDPFECRRLAEEVLDILGSSDDDHACENRLVKLLQFDKFELLSVFLENRAAITWGTKFSRAENADDKERLLKQMETDERARPLVEVLFEKDRKQTSGGKPTTENPLTKGQNVEGTDLMKEGAFLFGRRKPKFPLRTLDLEGLSFQKGGQVKTLRNCELPPGSQHIENKDFEEWHIPAIRALPDGSETLVSISDLPNWARLAFPSTRQLNRVQSAVYQCAFTSDQNMLLCAPTGAGKTNVALLSILRAINNAVVSTEQLLDGTADLSSLKVVYVAPMKALVSEVVENLAKRLNALGLEVRELTGDINLSRKEVEKTHIIVTTPEKWDIITRKSNERSFTRLVSLLIVDEVHLLHDERGPVLEAIIARTLGDVGSAFKTRIVGLSATLPNYKDVAAFMRVDLETGLFHFGSEYRPCPLQQCYVGITAKKALRRFQIMNEITYDKTCAQLEASNQTIIFVHSRKETAATAQFLVDKAVTEEVIDKFLKPKSGSFEIIQSELPKVSGKDLYSLLEYGLGIHHAGMTRSDRHLVERLFEAGHIKVLVSTATLAWGVNLPAHAVIIKGTQVYSPEHGRWTQLSSMDVMQMMGRAGRPQFDTFGEGVIITAKTDVLFYLSLLNNQLPIESQMVSRLTDMLNAEVVNNSISSIVEGSDWLSLTYLYIRMLQNPVLYSITVDEREADTVLSRRRAELIHSAAIELHNSGLIRYNKKTGELLGTEMGKIAADFYVTHRSMAIYTERLKECNSDIDLLRVFSVSGEFRHMRVRDEEKLELARLADRVPIPIKDSLDEPTAKVNVLLQAFISNFSLDGLALRADMVYISQSAGRLCRALLLIAHQLKNAMLFGKCLALTKSVSSRQWTSQSPLRQFHRKLGKDVVRRIERKDYPFERYYDLNVSEIGELLKNPQIGKTVHRLVHSLPRMEMDARVRPLSRTTIEVELTLLPDFRFDRSIHGGGELFWILVEDANSEHLLYGEQFFLKNSLSEAEHFMSFTLPLTTPLPPQHFIRCVSDRWIVPDTQLPISYRNLILPEKFSPHSKLADIKPLSIEQAFQIPEHDKNIADNEQEMARREVLADAFKHFSSRASHLSPLQSQLFPTLFGSDDDAVISTLPDIERDSCIELCLVRLFSQAPTSIVLWIAGKGSDTIDQKLRFVKEGIGSALNLNVNKFISERTEDVSVLRLSGSIVFTTATKWDMFSRRWREKRVSRILKKVGLIILDDIHMLSDTTVDGAAMEIVASRMRYFAAEARENGESSFRIAAFSDPVANAREIGHWLGCPPSSVFSFHPRDVCKDFKLVVMSTSHGGPQDSRAVMLCRPVYSMVRKYIGEKNQQVLIYAPSRKIASGLAVEMAALSSLTTNAGSFFQKREEGALSTKEIRNHGLKECLDHGIGFLHEGLPESDKDIVKNLFKSQMLRMLVATASNAWQTEGLDCQLVIIAGTESIEEGGTLTKRKEYSRSLLMKMMFGIRNIRSLSRRRVGVILTESIMKEFYKTHYLEPPAVESQLPMCLPDHLNAEIASGVIESKQDAVDYLTWTFFYRRLPKNPNYYGMKGVSPLHISNHLSEMVEVSLSDLETSKCVRTEGENDVTLKPLNLGIIAAHYYLRHASVELFASSITSNTNLNGLLNIVSHAAEFERVAVRNGEEDILREMGASAHIELNEAGGPPSYSKTHIKVHLLLQSQMNRDRLVGKLREDQNEVVRVAVRLSRAMVDIISSAGWLNPAIAAIELCQMLVQGVWDSDSALLQLPHIDRKRANLLKEHYNVSDIFEFLDMEDGQRIEALNGLSNHQISDIAIACQQFPSVDDIEVVEVTQTLDEDDVRMARIVILVRRSEEEENKGDDENYVRKSKVPLVNAPRFPETREEGWWIIVGDESRNNVFTVKHITLKTEAIVKLEFSSPTEPGNHTLQVYLMSDSYVADCDQKESFTISVEGLTMDDNNIDNRE